MVYANGFMVGDGQIQSKYQSLEAEAMKSPGNPLSRRDYRSSARR